MFKKLILLCIVAFSVSACGPASTPASEYENIGSMTCYVGPEKLSYVVNRDMYFNYTAQFEDSTQQVVITQNCVITFKVK